MVERIDYCWLGSRRVKRPCAGSAAEASFDALCHEYREVIEFLDRFEAEVKRLRRHRAWQEEELLTRIEGHQPQ